MKSSREKWLLLIHQIPSSPPYLRIKMWRQLLKVGAVAVKNAVYVLPRSEQTLEDFHWIAKEIQNGKGEASVCEAKFVVGLSDDDIVSLFQAARDADYAKVLEELRAVRDRVSPDRVIRNHPGLIRIRQRLEELGRIDFFESSGRNACGLLLAEIEASLRRVVDSGPQGKPLSYSGRTWVTRKGVHVDRIASAWLIRRFIDSRARFKFVPPQGYRPKSGEIRFDMFDAEFTHQGDRCTFEVLVDRFCPKDRGLHTIAEIVHDIDLKTSKFGRSETAGFSAVINAVCRAHADDADRIARASAVLDDLYPSFKSNKG